jgi:hypothetical protein
MICTGAEKWWALAFAAIRRQNCKAMMILVLAHCIIRGSG